MIPKNIKQLNIESALDEIDREGIRKGRHSNMYDLFTRGNRYPPKLVLSIANRYANGEELDPGTFSGGEDSQCFKVLREFGYEIHPKSYNMKDKRFSWVQTHKELVEYLKKHQDDQLGLIKLLQDAGATVFNDRDADGNEFDLYEIEPFTFFCYIYKYGPEKRLELLQNIARRTGSTVPEGESGVPSANPQKVWLFPYKEHRIHNEINRLWGFFNKALSHQLLDEDFRDILKIKGVAITKLSEALFYIDPENYFPINAPSKPYLKEVLGIDPAFKSFTEYKKILDQIKAKSETPFYKLSHEAWVWNEEFRKNRNLIDVWEKLQSAYRKHVVDTGIEEELYKWQSIHHFQSVFDITSNDFGANLKLAISKSKNLLYSNSRGYINKFAEYYPEEAKAAFIKLYDENISIEDRLRGFTNTSEQMLHKVSEKYGKTLNHQQDERTISYYLAMQYPEKYPIFKDEIYQFLVENLKIKPKKAGEKYLHYLELAELFSETIKNDVELNGTVQNQLKDNCFKGDQAKLIFQDCLWINKRKLARENIMPPQDAKWHELQATAVKIDEKEAILKFFEITNQVLNELNIALDDEVLYASAIGKKIQITVGNHYLSKVERVNSEVQIGAYCKASTWNSVKPNYPDAQVDLKGENVWLKMNASEFPIEELIDDIIEVAEDLRNQYSKSPYRSQYKDLHNDWITKISNKPELTEYLLADYYLLGSKWGDEEKVDDFKANGEWVNGYDDGEFEDLINEISIGSKVGVKAPFTREGQSVMYIKALGIVVENQIDGKTLKVNWEKDLTRFEVPFSGGYRSTVHKITRQEHILPIWFEGDNKSEVNEEGVEYGKDGIDMKYSLNTILYGPPGTGKTYRTIKIASEIVSGRQIDDYEEAKKVFNNELGNTIEFITFHQNYSYEDFIQGLRPDIDGVDKLLFKRNEGVFKKLCDRARSNTIPLGTEFGDYKVSKWGTDVVELTRGKDNSIRYVPQQLIQDLMRGLKSGLITLEDISNRRNGDKHIAEVINSRVEKYYFGIDASLVAICEYLSNHRTNKNNYVLIIDEINRANISRVFGELITLIEEDKRLGSELHIPATLPSGESFSVPKNLYILGTMNTADKSIALLDIALRRRFTFEAMYPCNGLDEDLIHDKEVLDSINEQIVKKKGHDFQVGHSYFMGNGYDLVGSMNRKVIPLLLEYFMNDEKEVKEILVKAGLSVIEKSWPLRIDGKV
jgi:5-methylcytosine-specific restriction protein B